MLENDLQKLIKDICENKTETNRIELKKATDGVPKRLYDTLSSFSNNPGGGIIIFGIDESNQYEITGVYDVQDLQKKVTEQALQMEPVVRPLFTITKIKDKFVVSAEIAECSIFDKPCYYKGAGIIRGSFIRIGDADVPMTEYEIYSYEAFKRKIKDELRIDNKATMKDLNNYSLDAFLAQLTLKKPNLMNFERNDLLRTQGIVDEGKPTVTGILLFGKYPQTFFPQLCITAIVVAGRDFNKIGENSERFIDNQRIDGTIIQMLESSLAFINRNTRTKTIIGDNGFRKDQTEYPMKAIREILLNALIHRDYSIHTENSPIRVIIFEDRIEIENPGGLYGRITVDELGKRAADTRNPFLAVALETLMQTENRFSGIPTIYNEMKKAGLTEPVFVNNRGVFKVILYNKEANQIVGDLENKIIEFCEEPRSREELSKAFNFSSTKYFINTYILPLVEKGELRMTIPDKPRSKNQKYVKKQ